MERHIYTVNSPDELRNYVHHLKIPRNAKITFWYEEVDSQASSVAEDWKDKWAKAYGLWSDYDDVQEDFRKIRESFNNRISQ